MSTAASHLRLVPAPPVEGEDAAAPGDVGLTAVALVIAALPLALAVAGVGRWDDGSVGLGTVGVIFAGRALLAGLLPRARPGRAP